MLSSSGGGGGGGVFEAGHDADGYRDARTETDDLTCISVREGWGANNAGPKRRHHHSSDFRERGKGGKRNHLTVRGVVALGRPDVGLWA